MLALRRLIKVTKNSRSSVRKTSKQDYGRLDSQTSKKLRFSQGITFRPDEFCAKEDDQYLEKNSGK